ncbi:MAG TPA: sulfatase-like hydrolase/transferase [Pirellulaceae bacterium]|jgi:arylsulfatase A-like enzyme|nr:sulfatase-like hydrolase/transferase [Pirellulaceae bacterium]
MARFLATFALASLALGAALKANDARPNIVLLIADDAGWGDVSLHGNTNLETPHLDSIAKEGARFERFYVSPLCAPTRASLLTGRDSVRTGVVGVTRGQERLNLDEVTLPEILQANGYATGAFGKWHNGSQFPYHPNGRGFDQFYGFCCGHWANYFDAPMDQNGVEIAGRGYLTDDITDHACNFIAEQAQGPFFCYVAFNTPHSPFQVPKEDYERVKARGITLRATEPQLEKLDETIAALAMMENLDRNAGEILAAIDDAGVRENTIVLYLTDNGPNTWRWNGGLKGKKGQFDEGGVRSPLFMRYPQTIEPGTVVKRPVAHIDLLPTLLDLCGLSLADAPRPPKPLDGRSFAPLLKDPNAAWPERAIYLGWGNRRAIREGKWYADAKSLYDLEADPLQKVDLAKRAPDVHAALVAKLEAWHAEASAGQTIDRPYPVGYREDAATILPVQDAELHGKTLSYSSQHPNASYATNWTSIDETLTFDVEVAEAGDYAAVLRYAAPAETVGSVLRLEGMNGSAEATVTEAFDPPLTHSPDYAPRTESYLKPFAPLNLGTIKLPAGRQTLTLRATKQAGQTLPEIRQLELERVAE